MKQKNNIFEELNKMKNLINTKRGVVISEQGMVGMTPTASAAPAAPAAPKSEEQKIADGIVSATQGVGTNEKNFLASINKIKDSKQFWNINAYLKTVGNKLDFAGIVNDEMDTDDGVDVQTIVNKLKSIGVGSTADINEYNNFKPGTFKFGPEGQANPAADKTKVVAGNKANDYARIVGDYSKKVQTSLGASPTGQLSDNDLEKILSQLSGEVSGGVNQTVQGLPTTADGQPDLEKILASL